MRYLHGKPEELEDLNPSEPQPFFSSTPDKADSVHIDACSYIVSDPCCLVYYGTSKFFLLDVSVVGLLGTLKFDYCSHPACVAH